MFRIDSEGSTIDNKFTEGDPQLGVPATVVSSDWANAVQEEISKVVEENGIALDKAEDDQLYSSLLEMFLRGGRKTAITQVLANNTGPADVAGFEFDSTVAKCKIAFFTIERKTSTQRVMESGLLFITWDSKNSVWRVNPFTLMDDADTIFTSYVPDIPGAPTVSRLQYTTGDLTGSSYVGNVNLTQVIEIRI